MRINRVYVFLVIALALIWLMAIKTGGVGNLLSYDCRRTAEAMGVGWMWDPVKGCFIQQPNGSWMPIDNNRVYQP